MSNLKKRRLASTYSFPRLIRQMLLYEVLKSDADGKSPFDTKIDPLRLPSRIRTLGHLESWL